MSSHTGLWLVCGFIVARNILSLGTNETIFTIERTIIPLGHQTPKESPDSSRIIYL